MKDSQLKGLLFGLAVGDALGVPVEFKQRSYLSEHPVSDMIGYGSHNQPKGTWSDDTSLALCLAESIAHGYSIQDLARRFVNWKEQAYWTPHGEVFDIGIATSIAIHEIYKGVDPKQSGGSHEHSNGNGSLMRILPLLIYIEHHCIDERFRLVREVSSLTHAHIRSVFSCFIYLEFALELLKETNKMQAFENMQNRVNLFWKESDIISEIEINKFHKLLCNPIQDYDIKPIYEYQEREIGSSGYVLDTLEAAFWCFLKYDSYSDIVLKAVNLGSDTDTTACVAGGLAGLHYTYEQIPKSWVEVLARREDITHLYNRLNKINK